MFTQSFPCTHYYIRFSLLSHETIRTGVIIPILQIREPRNRPFNYIYIYTHKYILGMLIFLVEDAFKKKPTQIDVNTQRAQDPRLLQTQ